MADDREDPKITQMKNQINSANLTGEQKLELGIWLTGKGMVDAWSAAFDGEPPD